MKIGLPAIATALCLVLQACKEEKPKPALSDIVGQWTVYAAKRNERPTKLLDGTYFDFDSTGNMRTNLPLLESREEWKSNFEFVNDSTLRFGQPALEYIVKNWSDSTLALEFTARGLPFLLYLARAEAPVGVPDTTVAN